MNTAIYMRFIIILLFLTTTVYAGSSVTKNWAAPAPPVENNETSLYDFLNFQYEHFNQSQIVTTNPNGNYQGKSGNFLIYNNSGTYQVCFETAQPSGTTWKCANLI